MAPVALGGRSRPDDAPEPSAKPRGSTSTSQALGPQLCDTRLMHIWSGSVAAILALLLALPASAQVRIQDPDDPFARSSSRRQRRTPPPKRAPSGWLGVELTPELKQPAAKPKAGSKGKVKGTPTGRVALKTVFKGSGAAAAGLLAKDIVLEINKTPITSIRQLIGLVRGLPVNSKVAVVIERKGKRETRTVLLGPRPNRQQQVRNAWKGKTLPTTFAFTDPLTGKKHTLGDFRGSPLIIEYWATYCGPCKRAAPWLSQLMTQHAAAGLKVIKVSTEAPATVRAHLSNKPQPSGPHPLTLLDSDDVIKRKLRLSAMPTFLYVNSVGVVVAISFGARAKSELDKFVQLALDKPRTGGSL